MNVIKEKDFSFILENDKKDQFQIEYVAADVYFTMLNYYDDNEFCISENDEFLYEQLEKIFIQADCNKLLNGNCFEWISEAYGLLEEQNKLTILKEDNQFIIKFFQNPNRMFNVKDLCPICFCLSGSKYQELSNAFSYMLQECNKYYKDKTLKLGL